MNYRIKFLSLWSSIMAEERWHKFDSQACIPSCKGWNAWAPLCECGKNYCRFKPSGNMGKWGRQTRLDKIEKELKEIQQDISFHDTLYLSNEIYNQWKDKNLTN